MQTNGMYVWEVEFIIVVTTFGSYSGCFISLLSLLSVSSSGIFTASRLDSRLGCLCPTVSLPFAGSVG